jgi:hypothetical protein
LVRKKAAGKGGNGLTDAPHKTGPADAPRKPGLTRRPRHGHGEGGVKMKP